MYLQIQKNILYCWNVSGLRPIRHLVCFATSVAPGSAVRSDILIFYLIKAFQNLYTVLWFRFPVFVITRFLSILSSLDSYPDIIRPAYQTNTENGDYDQNLICMILFYLLHVFRKNTCHWNVLSMCVEIFCMYNNKKEKRKATYGKSPLPTCVNTTNISSSFLLVFAC